MTAIEQLERNRLRRKAMAKAAVSGLSGKCPTPEKVVALVIKRLTTELVRYKANGTTYTQ